MQRFLNDPAKYVDDMIGGLLAAHGSDLETAGGDPRCIVSARSKPGKVGIATGGGSGHLPLFLGYVGDGLLDGCSVGGVFQSPSAEQMLEVTKHIHQGAGVLYIYGNYGGDIMNFDRAAEMADMEDIEVSQTVGRDDVASSVKGEEHKRRGVAGIFFVYKVAGACADELKPLEEVHRVAEKANSNVRTMGVALSPCILPEIGKPTFSIGEGQMEIGMGIHGEPGIEEGPLKTADEIATAMVDRILADGDYASGDEVAVLVNGLGATPKEELYILFKKTSEILTGKGLSIYHAYIGEFATSMDMAGASISVLKLDDELKHYLSKPAYTPFFTQLQLGE